MTNKLYVGNLDYSITEGQLDELFSEYGKVKEVKLILDKNTRKSRGFAFVTMNTKEEAEKAIGDLSDAILMERALKISYAREQRRRDGERSDNRRSSYQNNKRH